MKRRTMLALRQEGKTYAEIAEIVKLHPGPVGKVGRAERGGVD